MVSHHALDADTELGEVSDSGLKKSHGTFLALIWHNLHEGDARSIIDADVDELPTDAMMAIDRARIATGDAMSHRADPAAWLSPSSTTLRTIASRPLGVRGAFL